MFKGTKCLFNYCWKFDKKYIILLCINELLGVAAKILSIIIPKYIIELIFVNTGNKNTIFVIVSLLFLTFVVSVVKSILINHLGVRKMRIYKKFQLYLSEILGKTDFYKIENYEYLELQNKAYKFVYGNGNGFAYVLDSSFAIFGNIVSLISILGILSSVSFGMMIIVVVIVVINTLIDKYYKSKNIKLNFEKVKYDRRSSYFSSLFSSFVYGKEIRINNLTKWLLGKYDYELENMQQIYEKVANNNKKSQCMFSFTSFLQQSILYSYVMFNVIKNNINVADFSMLLNAIQQFSHLLSSVFYKIVDLRQYNQYYYYFEKYMSINKEYLSRELISISSDVYEFEFKNVSFKYYGQKNYALKNVNIKFNSTDKIAIVGENGSGKSTFIKLLLGLYEPSNGMILVNGYDIKCLDKKSYSNIFSAVFQDFKLISMSFKDNIVLDNEYDENKFNDIMKQCSLIDIISRLPDKVDTFIYKNFSETGIEPSGGEIQRIAIAKAFYRDCNVLVLDEPTAALDPISEYNMYNNFNNNFKGKGVLFISHRLCVTKFTNKIFTFKQGKIIEEGNHNDLLKKGGVYYNLYKQQSSLYDKL